MISAAEALNFYEKTKKDWNSRSVVRNSKETYEINFSEIGANKNLSWHIPSYSTILNHEYLKGLSEGNKNYIMGTQLLEFVEKTAVFEVDYVNKVANNLALGKYNFDIPNVLKLDALKIYTDEGYHAHFSKKMADDIKKFYNIKDDLKPYLDNFFNKVNKIGSSFDKKFKYLSDFSSTLISETMIVQDMSNEMKGIVHEPIRLMFKDHITDEMFHANYFSTIFKILWPQLSDEEKEILGLNMCESMQIFAKPRVDIYYYSLSKLGYEKNLIEKIVLDTFKEGNAEAEKVKKRMSQTLLLLEKSDVFRIKSVKNNFQEQGFI